MGLYELFLVCQSCPVYGTLTFLGVLCINIFLRLCLLSCLTLMRLLWLYLVYFERCFVVLADLIVMFEDFFFWRFNVYSFVYSAIKLFMSFFCQTLVWAVISLKHGIIMFNVETWVQPNIAITAFPPPVSHGDWCGYKIFSCYTLASKSKALTDNDNVDGDPWWFHLPSYFSHLRDRLQQLWRVQIHLCWWSCLKHQLHLLCTSLW